MAGLLGLGLLLPMAAGCGAGGRVGAGGSERIEMWAMGREGEVVPELLPEFERLHPGVRVEVQQIPWTAAHEKLLTAYVGRSTPDVAVIGTTWVPELAAIGALADLDANLAASHAVAAGDFFGGSWETGVIDGRVYSVPWYVDTRLLFYRTDLLAAAGCQLPMRTWSAWRRCMERVKARAGAGAYAILLPTDEWEQPVILALQLGAPLLRDGGRYGAFRDPRVERAEAFYVDLFRRGLAPRVGDNQVPNAAQLFGQGFFAMYITGPWNLGEFRRRLPPALAGSWATAPLPAPDEVAEAEVAASPGATAGVSRGTGGGSTAADAAAAAARVAPGAGMGPKGERAGSAAPPLRAGAGSGGMETSTASTAGGGLGASKAGAGVGTSVAGGANLAIFSASRHRRVAWELIEFLAQPAQQARFYALVGDLPARRAAWQDQALAADPRVQAFREQLQHAMPAPKVPEWEQIATRVLEAIEPSIRGRQPLGQALAGLDRDVDRILEKRRWLLDRRLAPAGRREAGR